MGANDYGDGTNVVVIEECDRFDEGTSLSLADAYCFLIGSGLMGLIALDYVCGTIRGRTKVHLMRTKF